jgi:hypothetical protein
MLEKRQMLDALREIGEKLAAEGLDGQILLAGGASMCLVHSARSMTRDMDAVYQPKTTIDLFSFEVGEKYGWEPGWLNSGVQAYIQDNAPKEHFISFPGLKVFTVSAEYLLAMKLRSMRDGSTDHGDAVFLIKKLGLNSVEETLELLKKIYDTNKISETALAALRSFFQSR